MAKSDSPRRIGVFGGTFNPVHHGHLINTLLIKENFNLDLIIFIPVKIPVHKIMADKVEPFDRLEMVRLAIEGIEYFDVSDIEITSDAPSYTITTLEKLKTLYPRDELFLIIGSDSFNELDTWREYKKILSCYPLIVMQREGSGDLREDILSQSCGVELHTGSIIDISSSMIRDRVKKGLSARYLTADKVNDFIMNKGLYKIEQ